MNLSQENQSILTNSGKFDDARELEQLFPTPVDSLKGSLSFAKNFTLLALSIISYSRGMFPRNAYAEKKYKGHTIQILNGRGACEEAHLVWKWMRSACKALEKGFMRELIFEVLSVEDTVVEYYAVEYAYDENNIKCSISSTAKTIAQFDHASFQNTFMDCFATITSFIKELEPLPAAFKLQLRINYYDAKTPEAYIPDYFRDDYLDPSKNKCLYIGSAGSIRTPFHHLIVRMASNLKRQADGENIISDQTSQKRMKGMTKVQSKQRMSTLELEQALMSQDEDKENVTGGINEPKSAPKTSEPRRHIEPSVPSTQLQPCFSLKDKEEQRNVLGPVLPTANSSISGPSSSLQTKSTPTLKKSGSQERNFARIVQMNCICNMNSNSKAVFECFHCQTWHHLVCYRRKPTSVVNPTLKYTCAKCAIEDRNSSCLDPAMATEGVPIRSIEDLAVYRQVIFRLQWFTLINMKVLMRDFRISEEQARSIISKLVKKNILRQCTRSEDYTLNTNQLMAFVNSYFK